MFTDIVGSTERAVGLGDRRWRNLLDSHHALIREQLARFRGREIDTTGDGAGREAERARLQRELADARAGKGYGLAMSAEVRPHDRPGPVETSRGSWADIHFSFGEMLARASADARLRAGDLVGSGTAGTGCLLEVREATLGRYLEPGDEVTLRVERLGELRTPVVARPATS